MKTLVLVIAMGLSNASAGYVYEFFHHDGFRLDPIFGRIEMKKPSGEDEPAKKGIIRSLTFRGADSGTDGIGPDGHIVLPNISSPEFTLKDKLEFFGTMTWDERGLSGFWSISPPVLLDGGGNFLATYYISDHSISSFWPLEYYFNESEPSGFWKRVPDSGATWMLLGLALCGIVAFQRYRVA